MSMFRTGVKVPTSGNLERDEAKRSMDQPAERSPLHAVARVLLESWGSLTCSWQTGRVMFKRADDKTLREVEEEEAVKASAVVA